VDADDAAVGLVGLERRRLQREIDHADVGGVDRADGEFVLVQSDLALLDKHAHGVERVPEGGRTDDGLEHMVRATRWALKILLI
jgi:hypothetical protein